MSVLFIAGANAQDQTINGNLYLGTNNSGIEGAGKKLYLRGTNEKHYAIYKYQIDSNPNHTDLRIEIGNHTDSWEKVVIGNIPYTHGKWTDYMVVTNQGRVGINGVRYPVYELDVNGTIRAKEVRVETGWADFVFQPDYNLPSLAEVEAHIKQHKHLPDIPSEAEVIENGISLGEMNVKLLQKIEELTLYMIEQNKALTEQNKKIQTLEAQVNLLSK